MQNLFLYDLKTRQYKHLLEILMNQTDKFCIHCQKKLPKLSTKSCHITCYKKHQIVLQAIAIIEKYNPTLDKDQVLCAINNF